MAKNGCKLSVCCEDGVLIASLEGELDHHGAVAVRTLIDKQIRDVMPKKAVLDLTGLDFMDSSGLGLIMGRYSLMKGLGGEFAVRNPTERVLRIFSLAGLERMVKIETDGKEKGK